MTTMNELERLRQGFADERIAARPEAKDAAIRAALVAFDAKSQPDRQGSSVVDRLRVAARAALDTLTGARSMHTTTHFTTRHALAAGASLAVLTLAVMTAANWQTIEGFGARDTAPLPTAIPTVPAQPPAVQIDAREKVANQSSVPPAVAPAEVLTEAASIDTVEKKIAAAKPEADTSVLSSAPPVPMDSFDASEVASMAGAPAAPSPHMALRDLSASNTTGLASVEPLMESAGTISGGTVRADEAQAPGAYHDEGRDKFQAIDTNPLKVTAAEPVSTFSIDVDTSSYSFMRAALSNGVLPQDDAVRVEELINYFPYSYPGPETAEEPFKTSVTVMQTPWNAATKLIHIGIKGFDITAAERPRANLVFLIDTSGSMDEPNKLPLLINSLKLLVDGLKADDTVAIVVYAGSAGTVLEPTKASEKGKILSALENLSAGGSTAGAEGIRQAYDLAKQNFDSSGVNRVILATDGDFNVGITDTDELEGFVERERESGIFLSVLGFGRGNYNDELMQALAQNGNGAAAYVDTLNEARKVLVDETTSTLFPIAKDVKIQVEFNPATVSEYRLIGYENRLLNREDFNNDKVDAGEIGSGHTVTAIYEIVPVGSTGALVDGLRYQNAPATAAPTGKDGEYAFLRLRYKLPKEETSKLIETPITASQDVGASGGGKVASEARFAASVAAFGQILRGGRYTEHFSYDDVIELANANKGDDAFGYRAEFVNLVRLAKSASSMERLQTQQ